MKHGCTMTAIMESVGYAIWLSGIAMLEVLPLMLLCIGCQHAAPPAAATSASRLSQPAHAAQVATAKDLFYKAVAGDLDSLPLSLQMFREMGGGDSADPQVVAYTGAAMLLKASHASLLEKGGLANEGLSLEDKAVVLAPNDLEVRLLRGVTGYKLPRFMGRSATAAADLAYVAKVAEQAVNDGRLDRRAAAADLVYYGKELEDHYDAAGAEAAWRAAVRINPDGSAGRDALKHLAEHHVAP